MKNTYIVVLVIIVVLMTGYIIKLKSFDGNQNTTVESGKSPVAESSDTTDIRFKLDLSGQGLTKAPDSIFNQTSLEELNLSNNSIGGALQSQVGNLKKLKILNLSNNKFTGVPAEVGQLKNLEILNLSNNQLTGLPNELANLSNLKFLDLTGNEYSEADLAKIKVGLPSSVVIKIK